MDSPYKIEAQKAVNSVDSFLRKTTENLGFIKNVVKDAVMSLTTGKGKEEAAGPLLNPPESTYNALRLARKLDEYQIRLAEDFPQSDYVAPEHPDYQSLCIKIAIIEGLIAGAPVDTHRLSREMNDKFKNNLNSDIFDEACGIIENYAKEGGKGTNRPLPEMEKLEKICNRILTLKNNIQLFIMNRTSSPFSRDYNREVQTLVQDFLNLKPSPNMLRVFLSKIQSINLNVHEVVAKMDW